MADEKRVTQNQGEERGIGGDVAAGFAGGVGAGVGTGLVAQASKALGKIKPKPEQKK